MAIFKVENDRFALISVAEKAGIEVFATQLADMGWGIISTGGTAKYLEDFGVPVKKVSDLRYDIFKRRLEKLGWTAKFRTMTHDVVPLDKAFEQLFPTEILNHRVATLHAEIQGGILAADDMLEELQELGFPRIDLVCIDLYDLETAMSDSELQFRDVLDQIDIGGPTALCGAAKNLRIVLSDDEDRQMVIDHLKQGGDVPMPVREILAQKAFTMVSGYRMMAAECFDRDNVVYEN